MKSNPVLYPLKSFPKIKNISKSEAMASITINSHDLKTEYSKIKIKKIKTIGANINEKILSIFLNKQFLFGPKRYIIESKNEIFKTIEIFVKKNKPIKMAILGFPFKMEIELKTNRYLADMGEVLMISQLSSLTKAIKKIYPPGAEITIFTEETFAKFAGVEPKKAKEYADSIKKLVVMLKEYENIKILSLSLLKKYHGFNKIFKKNKGQILKEIKNKKGKEYEKYLKSFPAVCRIVSVKNIPDIELYKIYTTKKEDLSSKNRQGLEKISRKAFSATVDYLAFLGTKNQLDFVAKTIGAHLPLTLSPKPHKIGIIPVNNQTNILPSHGVPVKKINGNWEILYLIEIKTNSKKYRKVFLKNDKDSAPFYYEEIR